MKSTTTTRNLKLLSYMIYILILFPFVWIYDFGLIVCGWRWDDEGELTHKWYRKINKIPKCIFCNEEAEFDVPADLCETHWQMWFDYKIEIPEKYRIK